MPARGVRPDGTTTCCGAYTSIFIDDEVEYCKACFEAITCRLTETGQCLTDNQPFARCVRELGRDIAVEMVLLERIGAHKQWVVDDATPVDIVEFIEDTAMAGVTVNLDAIAQLGVGESLWFRTGADAVNLTRVR